MFKKIYPFSLLKSILEVTRSRLLAWRYSIEDTIVISGTPRSGTTWLLEILSSMGKYLTIFEPLNQKWFPESLKVGFGPRDYINPKKSDKLKEIYLEKIFTGKIASKLPHYSLTLYNIINRLLSTKIIVKFVRANRIIPWIAEKFPVQGIVVILRHPCAVIESQLRRKINGYYLSCNDYVLEEKILTDAKKIDIIDKNLIKFIINKEKTPHELLAIIWALDTLIPLYYWKNYKYFIVTYENLIQNPNKVLCGILNHLGLNNHHSPIIESIINKPSYMTNKSKKYFSNSEKIISCWKNNLSISEIKGILEIINIFGIDFYSAELLPDEEKLKKWRF